MVGDNKRVNNDFVPATHRTKRMSSDHVQKLWHAVGSIRLAAVRRSVRRIGECYGHALAGLLAGKLWAPPASSGGSFALGTSTSRRRTEARGCGFARAR
jgi:hypothetical protein